MQLQGLEPGSHRLTLIPSAEREYRFRLNLFSGLQILDLETGELRAVLRIDPPPEFAPQPADLPSSLAPIYDRFARSLWAEQLIQPEGNSAWDYYEQLRPDLPSDLADRLRNRLVAQLGNRSQRIILKYLQGGDIKWNAGIFQEGVELTARARQLFKSTSELRSQEHFFRGRALIEQGQYSRAQTELERATQLDREASHAYNALGLAFWKQNRLQEAMPHLQKALELSPQWTYPRNTLALIYLEQRRYSEAESNFRTSMQVDANDSTAYHGLRQLYFLLGRWDDSEELLKRSLDVHPGNAYAHETWGRLYQRRLEYERAEEMVRLAIRLEPDEPSFRRSLAEILRLRGAGPEGESILADLLRQNPGDVQTLEALAGLLQASGRSREAEEVYQRALKAAPRNASLRVRYGLLLQQQQRLDEAVDLFREALHLERDNPYAHYNLALVYLAQQKLDRTEKALQQAVQADPRYAAPRLMLGRIRFAQQRYPEARREYEEALKLSIEDHQRQELREYIQQTEEAIARDRLNESQQRVARGEFKPAWRLLTETLRDAPSHPDLRNAILQFLHEHSESADLSALPDGTLSQVLNSAFWKRQRRAEKEWQEGRQVDALEAFRAALGGMTEPEKQLIGSTTFNLANEDHGLHQLVYRWGLRGLERGEFETTLKLMELAAENWIFAAVPDFSPRTVDSLMRPEEGTQGGHFSDFEISHHPDRRAHQILALAHAGLGRWQDAAVYLPALETRQPDTDLRFRLAQTLAAAPDWEGVAAVLTPALEHAGIAALAQQQPGRVAEAFVLWATSLCHTGNCPQARQVLDRALEMLPGQDKLMKARQELP